MPRPQPGYQNHKTAFYALSGFVVQGFTFLMVIGLATTDSNSEKTTLTSPPSTSPQFTSTAAATTAPRPDMVEQVLAGDSVVVNNGTATRTVTIAGIDAPDPATAQCWSAEAVTFASDMLLGKPVQVLDGGLLLADGHDYAELAISAGVGRSVTGSSAVIKDAEAAAKLAGLGLWGAPCQGRLVLPVPVQPPPTAAPEPEPEPANAYYANCAAVRAAGAAPLHRGEPGYRAGLDRDGDGTACE